VKPKVYVNRLIPEEALKKLAQTCDYRIWEGEVTVPRDVLLREVAEVDGLLSLLTDKIDAPIMDAAPRLRVISNMAVGFDNIDVREATKRKIVVCNTPGVLTETTADFAFALLLAAARRVAEGERNVKEGKWKTWGPMTLLGHDVHHATLGIIGLGRIGAEVAKRAKGFDMKTLYYDSVRRPELEKNLGVEFRDLKTLLGESDFVTVHAPLLPETYHLIGEEQFKIMKKTAIVVNTARGPIVDPKALYNALRNHQIAYAALDVTEPEPIPLSDPLLTLNNILIVPHIASASVATRTKMALMAVDNLLAALKGERPPHIVNPEVLAG
jgi:glyoxylate reductase